MTTATSTKPISRTGMFPVSESERWVLLQSMASRHRPWFVESGSHGYSGGSDFDALSRLSAECNGDRTEFARRRVALAVNETELSEGLKDELAAVVAARILRSATGSVRSARMWRLAAKRAGLVVEEYDRPGDTRGMCLPSLFGDSGLASGSIAVNVAYPVKEQAAAWVHELAHMVLFAWLPGLCGECGQRHYEGDPDDVGHDIARRVERIIFA